MFGHFNISELSILRRVDRVLVMEQTLISQKKDAFATIHDKSLVNFTSNDYLGLSDNQELKEHIKYVVDSYGIGSTGSRRLSGNHQIFLDTEEHIAKWLNKPAAVMFNSGYQMNCSIFSALCSRSCLIVTDKYIHASIIDGIQHSGAQFVRFRHNDMSHLSQVLKKYANNKSNVYIVCESIYSMDGDTVPINDVIKLKKEYNATLIVDEAHSIGLYGNQGKGWLHENKCINDVDIILLAFGKSFGLSGAMLLSSQDVVQKIKSKCRSYIYSTALPLPIASGIKKASEIISERHDLIEKLKNNISYFKALISTKSNTQIQPIIIGDKDTAIQVEKDVIEKGLFLSICTSSDGT